MTDSTAVTDPTDPELLASLKPPEGGRVACLREKRPCRRFLCSQNLATALGPAGQLTIRKLPPGGATCALEVRFREEPTLADLARVLGLSRERVRQIECRALAKLRAALQDQAE